METVHSSVVFYSRAIKDNANNSEATSGYTWAILDHYLSTAESPARQMESQVGVAV